jgi:S-adenosylmethionine synthetase
MARYIAKNVVAAGLAEKCTVQLGYAIGVADPVGVYFDTHGTGAAEESKIEAAVRKLFPMTPKGIIQTLKLRRPVYRPTAAFGHFGREENGFEWEKTDKAAALREEVLGKGAKRALATV